MELRRRLVAAEKARAELAAKSAAEVRAAQMQMSAIAKQAAVATQATMDKLRLLESEKDINVASVKTQASSVITALMDENTRLKSMLSMHAAGGSPGPMPPHGELPMLRSSFGRSSLISPQ